MINLTAYHGLEQRIREHYYNTRQWINERLKEMKV